MSYFVYILRCSDGTLYTGITNDLGKRLKKHNGQLKGGAKYTRSRRPVELAYVEAFQSRSEVLKRENFLKSLSKSEKERIITPG